MTRILPVVLALLALSAPASAAAQSLFNAAGLGLPTEAMDARSRSLGGVGLGLQGASIQPMDPAASARVTLPTVFMTAQPTWVGFDRSDTGESGSFRSSRFPNMGIAYPVLDVAVATFTIESVMDQRYQAERPVEVELGGVTRSATDGFISEGGVSRVRLGLSRALTENAAVGVSLGRYSGSVVRRLVRSFADSATVNPYESSGRWSYSGISLTGGGSAFLAGVAQVAASMTWSTDLTADPRAETPGGSQTFTLPLRVDVGATAVLAPGLSVSAGLSTANWSAIDDDLQEGVSEGRTNSLGVGVELARASLLGRQAPLRLGYRRTDLPFTLRGGAPVETAFTSGLGIVLARSGDVVQAAMDLALERGSRSDDAISETFWRATLTLRVSGF